MARPSRITITYKRRISRASRQTAQEYGALTAETLWAWNRVNSCLLDLFASFLGDEERFAASYAIWHSFQSDSSQHSMLKEVAAASLSKSSSRYKQIKWLIDSIGKIAPYRNAAVHVPMVFQALIPGEIHAMYLDEKAARDVAKRRLETAGTNQQFWNTLAGDLCVLGQFALALAERPKLQNVSGRLPLLHRPKLRSLRLFAEIDRRIAPPQKKATPKRRKPSSVRKLD